MSERRSPKRFFEDLYKDLDDRHLLLPAIALVIALIAVPMLLSTGTETPATPAPVASSGEPTAVDAAVLTSDAGVRNYRERLENLRETNPFKQQFVSSSGSSDTETADAGGSPAASTDTGGFPVAEDVTSTGGSSAPASPTDTVTDPTPETDPLDREPEPETITETKEVTRLITRRIDVAVGAQGGVEERKGVKDLTVLPSKQKPVVVFLGVSEDAKRATFAISADVASTGGSGTCVGGGPIDCEFLELKIGQQQSFEYAPDGQTYKLKLLGIEDHEVKTRGT